MILDLEIRIEQGPAANDAPSGNECQGRKLADIIIHSRKDKRLAPWRSHHIWWNAVFGKRPCSWLRGLPAESEALPASSEALSAGSEGLPGGSKALRAGSEALRAGSEALPAGSKALTTGSEAHPAQSEAHPALS